MTRYCCVVESRVYIEKCVDAKDENEAKEKIREMFSKGIGIHFDEGDIDYIEVFKEK